MATLSSQRSPPPQILFIHPISPPRDQLAMFLSGLKDTLNLPGELFYQKEWGCTLKVFIMITIRKTMNRMTMNDWIEEVSGEMYVMLRLGSLLRIRGEMEWMRLLSR